MGTIAKKRTEKERTGITAEAAPEESRGTKRAESLSADSVKAETDTVTMGSVTTGSVTAETGKPKKESIYQRFKRYRADRKLERAFLSAEVQPEEPPKRHVSEFLNLIETQLGSLDEQNKLLLMHMATVKDNNDTLMEQVKILSKNNELLYRQFNLSKRREKISKTIAIISSSLAIGLAVYKFLQIFGVL
jgi:hypothetical protein